MSRPAITYFDARARAEPIRVILEELAIAYDDFRLDAEAWASMKNETPFGALPSYRDGDLEIFQSHAVFRHLARVHDLYGAGEEEHVRCDTIEEALADLHGLVGGAPWRQDFEKTRADFVASELSLRLGQLERLLETNDVEGGFWVGASITFVDLFAYALLDCTRGMFPEATAAVPVLLEFCNRMASRPRIAAYLESGRQPTVIQYGPGGPIYGSNF